MKRTTKKNPTPADLVALARANGVRAMLSSSIGAAAAELGEQATKKELRAWLRDEKMAKRIVDRS